MVSITYCDVINFQGIRSTSLCLCAFSETVGNLPMDFTVDKYYWKV